MTNTITHFLKNNKAMVILGGTIVAMIVFMVVNPPPPTKYVTYIATVEDKVVKSTGTGLGSSSITVCVITDHFGEKRTFTYPRTYSPCLFQIGDKVLVKQAVTGFPDLEILEQVKN